MKFRFFPEARTEMLASAAYYDEKSLGLGYEFISDVNSTITLITNAPRIWKEVSIGVHCLHLSRFPFAVIYAVRSNEVVIISVMHCKRRPNIWKKRIADL
jgi:hypothetical protein